MNSSIVTHHPLMSGQAPSWASEWGQDEYGPFAVLEFGSARQMLRWIPPGQFVMALEASDSERNGTQRERLRQWVTLTRGFWIFDTPVTNELWEKVTDVILRIQTAPKDRWRMLIGWSALNSARS